tara:strand:- start:2987 stop:3781 length:795 start_codon:yes stop_codon:yes gene_type:complete
MNDDEYVSQIETLKTTNELLRESVMKLKAKIQTLEKSPKEIMSNILRTLKEHYKSNFVRQDSILSNYYAVDDNNKYHALPDELHSKIEDLLYGIIQKINDVVFQGKIWDIHIDNHIKDEIPLILMTMKTDSAQKYMAISLRKKDYLHIHLFQSQPRIDGLQINGNIINEWLKNMKHNESDFYLNDTSLNDLSDIWLGRTSKKISNIITADSDSIIDFLYTMQTNIGSKCYFLLSGNQSPFLAYIQVNDKDNRILYVLPVGSVNE